MKCFYIGALLCLIYTFYIIPESCAQLKLYEDFESGVFPSPGWTTANFNSSEGEWKLNGRNTNSGKGCAVSNFSVTGAENYLISKRFIPSHGDSLVFYFKQTFWNNYNDTFKVKISNTDSLPGSMNTILFSFYENVNYPVYSGYGRYSLSLNSYAGQTVWLGFLHKNINGDNIRLDNITVGKAVLYDVSLVENIFPKGKFGTCSVENIIPSAKLRNTGSENITEAINVTYKISGPVNYISTKEILLNAGEEKVVFFDTTFISLPGIYNVKVYSSLPGDPVLSNDTVNSAFEMVNANFGGGQFFNGGYYFSNSTDCAENAQSSPEFSWKDTLNSISLILNGDVNSQIPFTGNTDNGYFSIGNILPQGYSFRYFNQNFDSVFISTNGIIGFKKNNALLSHDPTKINSLFFIQLPAICPFWSDLDFGSGSPAESRLSYKLAGKYLYITFDNAYLKSGALSEYLSFQICLELVNNVSSNSRFSVQYNKESTGEDFLTKYFSNTLRPHFVGFKNTTGSNYLKYRYRDSTGLTDYGTLFNSSVSVEFGQNASLLNNKSSDLNLILKLEAIHPGKDSVQIQIRDTFYPYNILESKKIYPDFDGILKGKFSVPAENYNYYIVVKHRNSIETWSREYGEQFTGFNLNYDFSSDSSSAYGNNVKNINGNYYIYSGDVDQDGLIDLRDITLISNDAQNFLTGYKKSDLNNDGIIDIADLIFCDNNAENFITYKSPLLNNNNNLTGNK
ncbi:MAG TPA: choice-of-anchor J domain-containing protein [Ignavibacteria bacterium]|nr:choice-of-anchor J domain-containing protein [Ignavibacteria bacterium]HRK00924.1 choice-of-anchor J domain-containing protein [Ignavibacteria bacterium]